MGYQTEKKQKKNYWRTLAGVTDQTTNTTVVKTNTEHHNYRNSSDNVMDELLICSTCRTIALNTSCTRVPLIIITTCRAAGARILRLMKNMVALLFIQLNHCFIRFMLILPV